MGATIAPPDMWSRQRDTGRTMAEIFMENGLGIIRAGNSRVQGWMALKEALKPMKSPEDRPGLLICESCRQLFYNLQSIQHDEKRPEDCAAEPHGITHAPDALRYFAVTRMIVPERSAAQEAPEPGGEAVVEYDEAMTGGEIGEDYMNYNG